MSTNHFSLLLKEYIHNNPFNVVSISKFTKIPRSTIQKYMSGIQIPSTFEPIEKICQYLTITNQQKTELKKAYVIEKVGYQNFKRVHELKSIIQQISNFEYIDTTYHIHYHFNYIEKHAKNIDELKLMLHFIINDALKSNKKLKLLMNCQNELFDIIFHYAKNNPDLKITQITNFKNRNNDINASNLTQLSKLLPFFLLDNNIMIRYIYSQEDNLSYYSIFPYAISSKNYVMLINNDFSSGILTNDNIQMIQSEIDKKNNYANQLLYKNKEVNPIQSTVYDSTQFVNKESRNTFKICTQYDSVIFIFDKYSITVKEMTICQDFLLLEQLLKIEESLQSHNSEDIYQ